MARNLGKPAAKAAKDAPAAPGRKANVGAPCGTNNAEGRGALVEVIIALNVEQ
jgi:hypothetical protein